MTNKRRIKPQPPVFTEADKQLLALMEQFRADMRVIEHERPADELESVLSGFSLNPLQFKYAHYDHLFKVWLAGRNQKVNCDQDEPLSIKFGVKSVTIEGITYANDIFRQIGGLLPLYKTFRLVSRSTGIDTGTVTIEHLRGDNLDH